MKSACRGLSNDRSHDGESELCQELLIIDGFPGALLVGNISKAKSARTQKKYFSGSPFEGQSIDVSFIYQFWLLVFGKLNAKVSLNIF